MGKVYIAFRASREGGSIFVMGLVDRGSSRDVHEG
jgi:hypothetical protein